MGKHGCVKSNFKIKFQLTFLKLKCLRNDPSCTIMNNYSAIFMQKFCVSSEFSIRLRNTISRAKF